MKQLLPILLIIIGFYGCKDDFTVDNPTVNSLKVYDFDVQRVKKIHNLFALIDTSAILFLNEDGDKVFDINNSEYEKDETIDFKFTDVVAGSNNEIFIIGAEILKDSTFQIYVFKVNENGQNIWTNPAKIIITEDYIINDRLEKFYFFISKNGYALGCFNDNKLFLVVNYESDTGNERGYYKLIAINTSGSVLMESMPIKEDHPEIWNYMINILPNGNLLVVLAVGPSDLYLHQFNESTFELLDTTKIKGNQIGIYTPILTNMLYLNNEEVIFTGHSDKRKGSVLEENFDAFLLVYNTITKSITNNLFFGVKSNFELTFNSFIDTDGKIKCIGAKRSNNIINHTSESNLFEIEFNLNSTIIDSLFIIKDKGYEGLYFEPVGNTGLLKILGSKLDISGRQNKQAFFTIVKP